MAARVKLTQFWLGKMANAVAKIIDGLRERGGLKGSDVANAVDVSISEDQRR